LVVADNLENGAFLIKVGIQLDLSGEGWGPGIATVASVSE